jgi:hypothetical protein
MLLLFCTSSVLVLHWTAALKGNTGHPAFRHPGYSSEGLQTGEFTLFLKKMKRVNRTYHTTTCQVGAN